jgi:hypothetical protein
MGSASDALPLLLTFLADFDTYGAISARQHTSPLCCTLYGSSRINTTVQGARWQQGANAQPQHPQQYQPDCNYKGF